jgi:hypothetical protein
MGLKGTATVDGDRPIRAESNDSDQEFLWKPRVVSARGTEVSILAEGAVGVIIHVHLKNGHENVTNPKIISAKVKTKNCNRANNSKEIVKMG